MVLAGFGEMELKLPNTENKPVQMKARSKDQFLFRQRLNTQLRNGSEKLCGGPSVRGLSLGGPLPLCLGVLCPSVWWSSVPLSGGPLSLSPSVWWSSVPLSGGPLSLCPSVWWSSVPLSFSLGAPSVGGSAEPQHSYAASCLSLCSAAEVCGTEQRLIQRQKTPPLCGGRGVPDRRS